MRITDGLLAIARSLKNIYTLFEIKLFEALNILLVPPKFDSGATFLIPDTELLFDLFGNYRR